MLSRGVKTEVFLQDISQPMLLVVASTGVTYTNQCNGLHCNQRAAEGFLVPLQDHGPPGGPLAQLKRIMDEREINDENIAQVTDVISEVSVFFANKWHKLRFDLERIDEAVEAWLPVTAHPIEVCVRGNGDAMRKYLQINPGDRSEGLPGWLIWLNSD